MGLKIIEAYFIAIFLKKCKENANTDSGINATEKQFKITNRTPEKLNLETNLDCIAYIALETFYMWQKQMTLLKN